MKKLLTIISAVTLTATGALTLVSCNNEKQDEQKEVSYEALMSSRVDTFFNGSFTIISTEGEGEYDVQPMPQDALMWKFLIACWTNDNKWIEGFLNKPNAEIKVKDKVTYVFKDFELKNEYKSQKQIILDSAIDKDHSKITHGDDEYTFPVGVDQPNGY